MTAAKPNLALECTLLLSLAAVWGASYTLVRIGVDTIPPITLIACRTSIAAAILHAVLRAGGGRMPTDVATWRRFAIQACLNSVVPFTLIAWAERTVEAALAAILNSTSPIFAFVLTAAFARHEPVTMRKLLGVATGLAGICLLVGIPALDGLGRDVWAQLAIVAATVCYAGAAIFGRSFKGMDPIVPAAGSLACGAVILLPVSLAVDRPWALTPGLDSLLALLGLAVFSTAVALVLYFRLSRPSARSA